MTIKTAIEKSIKGGWKLPYGMYEENLALTVSPALVVAWHSDADHTVASTPIEVILLDPSFWESYYRAKMSENGGTVIESTVKKAAHQLARGMIDHIFEDKSIESFFESL